MTADILAFPLNRRLGYIRRQGDWLASMSAKAADSVLLQQLQVQRDTLLRKGVDLVAVEVQLKELEDAIRAEVWKLVMTGGSAR